MLAIFRLLEATDGEKYSSASHIEARIQNTELGLHQYRIDF